MEAKSNVSLDRKIMGFWVLLLSLGLAASSCPRWQCANLASDTCVNWYQDVVLVNNLPCSATNHCSYAGTLGAIRIANLTRDAGEVACVHNGGITPKEDYLIQGNMNCWLDDPDDKLKEGTAPKLCTNLGWEDEACRLANNHISECVCGLDGNYYCALSTADTVLESYWELCKAVYISEARQTYWALLREYYVLFMVRPT